MDTKNNLKTSLNIGTLAGYGFGGQFAIFLGGYIFTYYQLPFFTEVVGLSTSLSAVLMTMRQIIGIVTMALGGIMIDTIPMKSGKLRPWCLIGGILYYPFSIFLLTNFNMTPGMFVVYFFVFFTLQQIAYAVWYSGSRALVGPMSRNSNDGIMLTTAAMLGGALGSTLYGVFSTPLLKASASSTNPYTMPTIVLSSVSAMGGIVLYIISKKFDGPRMLNASEAISSSKTEKPHRITAKEMLAVLKGPGVWYMLSASFSTVQGGFFAVLLFYYTKFILKNPDMAGLAVTVNSIALFLGSFTTPFFTKHFTKKQVYIAVHIVTGACYLLIFIFGNNATMFLVGRAIIGLVNAGQGITLPALANDLSDYKEMTGESQARGFVQSMLGIAIKIGSLIASSAASFGLVVIGYDALQPVTPEIVQGIKVLIGVFPAIVCFLAGIFMIPFKVDEKVLDEYKQNKSINN